MRALVTGFEAFDGNSTNASHEAVRRLPFRIGGLDITTAQLPTSYARAGAALERAIARVNPDVVLCVGEASERLVLNIERVAINVQDARIPDNDGARPLGAPVVPGAPAAYFATLPAREIEAELRAAGLAAEVSNSAGTFVCNHVFYGLMHYAARNKAGFRGGFLHVPASAMALDDIVRGILIVLETVRIHPAP